MNRTRAYVYGITFLAGAATMAFELLVGKLVAPHFGSTILSWGNFIGVILCGLAAGYAVGGRLADRRQDGLLPGAALVGAGGFIVLAPVLVLPVSEALLKAGGSLAFATLEAALALCLVPAAMLGFAYPFGTRLLARSLDEVGTITGRLSAVSFAGNLVGTFLTTFVLVDIEALGTRRTLWLTGCLLAAGAIPYFFVGNRPRRAGLATAVSLLFLVTTSSAFARSKPKLVDGDVLLEERESPYHVVRVLETAGGNRRYRALSFGESWAFHSGVFPALDGLPTVLPYNHFFLMAWAMKENIERIAVIGGGGGVVPRDILRLLPPEDAPRLHIDVIEIDPLVIAMARKYFEYPEDGPRLTTHAMDGRYFLQRQTTPLDLVILDGFSAGGRVPEHLNTLEYFQAIDRRLTPGGVVAVNVIAPLDGPGAKYYFAVLKTLEAVFGEGHVAVFRGPPISWPDKKPHPKTRSIVLLATHAPVPDELPLAPLAKLHRFRDWAEYRTLRELRLERALPPVRPESRDDFARAPRLTDDFNPVNAYVAVPY